MDSDIARGGMTPERRTLPAPFCRRLILLEEKSMKIYINESTDPYFNLASEDICSSIRTTIYSCSGEILPRS